jgi:hypothetical protein
MPYIKPSRRPVLDKHPWQAKTPGELNYVITQAAQAYIYAQTRSRNKDKSFNPLPGYAIFNEVIGALECAKLELYRRLVAPYEDTKIAENGDVY